MANFKLPYTGTNWNKHNGVGVTLIENWFEERAVAEQMITEHEKAQKEINRRMVSYSYIYLIFFNSFSIIIMIYHIINQIICIIVFKFH